MENISAKLLRSSFLLGVCILATGCVSSVDAVVAPKHTLTDLGTVYIQHFAPDKRNLNYKIAYKLTELGYPATPLQNDLIPSDADIVVTYVDNWNWDITNYMRQIKINFRDGKTEQIFATGKSVRSSLKRESPAFMIQETLERMLQEFNLPYKKLKKE